MAVTLPIGFAEDVIAEYFEDCRRRRAEFFQKERDQRFALSAERFCKER